MKKTKGQINFVMVQTFHFQQFPSASEVYLSIIMEGDNAWTKGYLTFYRQTSYDYKNQAQLFTVFQ